MSPRPPTAAPRLPGYEYEQLLGSGGFADVFLYRQQRPQRRVAIKVLLGAVLDESVRRQFDAEANVMATMSTHPSIVSIHAAEVSEDHRPFIVMEYCSRPNYGVRFRKERITVAEALRVGVQIAGAVETAHRAGILHRDIKPANILVTDYNRPALTDFGISMATGQGHDLEDSQGLSIPWSPPEVFADPPRADVRSDVFSLAASVYSLLASRTPFERSGQRNTASDLIHRISTEPLHALERPDVPAELNRVLSIAMAKDPSGRYDTALAFGRALQQVEMALSLPVTQMDVLDDRGGSAAPSGEDDDLEAHTRIRKVSTVDPEESSARRPALDRFAGVAPALASPAPDPGRPRPAAPLDESTQLRPAGALPTAAAAPEALHGARESERAGAPVWPFVTLAAVLVLALGVGSTLAVRHFVAPEPTVAPTTDVNVAGTPSDPPGAPLEVAVTETVPSGVVGQAALARVTWEVPEDLQDGQFFQVRWVDLPDGYERNATWVTVYGRSSVTVEIPPNIEDPCLEVMTADPTGNASERVGACLETG